jgi:hypothetical protein
MHVAHLSCCSESQGVRRVVVVRHGHQGMGRGELEADGRGARRTSVLRSGRARGQRSGRDGGGVRMRGVVNDLESRLIGRATSVRRVLRHANAMTGQGAHAGLQKSMDGGCVGVGTRTRLDVRALAPL